MGHNTHFPVLWLLQWWQKWAQESGAVQWSRAYPLELLWTLKDSVLYFLYEHGLFTSLALSSASVKWDNETYLWGCVHTSSQKPIVKFSEILPAGWYHVDVWKRSEWKYLLQIWASSPDHPKWIVEHLAAHHRLLLSIAEVMDTKHLAQCLVHDKKWEFLLLLVTQDALTLPHSSFLILLLPQISCFCPEQGVPSVKALFPHSF